MPLRYKFLVFLGVLAGAAWAIGSVTHYITGESFSHGMGMSFPRAPKMQNTGVPGKVVDSFSKIDFSKPQGSNGKASFNGRKRYDIVYYARGERIDFGIGCDLSIVGPTSGEGGDEITWSAISVVRRGGSLLCYAPRGPIKIATGAMERTLRASYATALRGDPAFATNSLSAEDVKKAIGPPQIEIIDGTYDQKNRPLYCQFPSCWRYKLKNQVDIYTFLNRSGDLIITYDGSGYSTKIENTLEKK
jgi:hypothetical protein